MSGDDVAQITKRTIEAEDRRRHEQNCLDLMRAIKAFPAETRQAVIDEALANIAEEDRRAAALAKIADLDTDAIESLLASRGEKR
jgi:hypothetical protein